MPGLVPGIHANTAVEEKDVDGRDEPGHDGGGWLMDGWDNPRVKPEG